MEDGEWNGSLTVPLSHRMGAGVRRTDLRRAGVKANLQAGLASATQAGKDSSHPVRRRRKRGESDGGARPSCPASAGRG
jgi:hypothetical protein